MDNRTALESPWFGEENPRRGLTHVELANRFVKDHPLGSTLLVRDFDIWLSRNVDGFEIPDVPKQDIRWKGHLHQRFEAKTRLNKAGATSKVNTPFVIVNVGSELYEVRRPQAAYASDTLPSKVQSLVSSKLRALTWIGQAIPSWELDGREIDAIHRLKRAIEGFSRHTNLDADLLNIEFGETVESLKRHFAKLDVPIPEEFLSEQFQLNGDPSSD